MATVLTGAVTLNVAFLATKASDPHTAQVFYFWALAYVASALQVMIMRRGGEKTDNVARPGLVLGLVRVKAFIVKRHEQTSPFKMPLPPHTTVANTLLFPYLS